jgi:hypothetical protein
MQVLIDRHPVDIPLAEGEPLGRLVEQVRALAAESRRVLANIAVGGTSVPVEQLDDWLARPCDQAGPVEFETACPRGLARQTIGEVSRLFAENAQLQQGAAEKLAAGATGKAMEQLAGCLGLYKAAQEAVSKAVQLNRLDLDQLKLGSGTMGQAIAALSGQLAEVKAALESHDLVLLADLVNYEFPKIAEQWLAILAELDRQLAD